jgi:putative hydrolase
MKIVADYHTHTTYSHGKGSIEDNVKVGIKRGLKEIAISDHGMGHLTFGIKKKNYPKMRAEIDRLNKKYPEINILLGLEANIMDVEGNLDIDDDIMKDNDVLMAGYHFGSSPKKFIRDTKMHFYNFMSKKNRYYYDKAKEINTMAMINAINKHEIKIITHPGAKGPIDLLRIAEAASNRGTALEINNSHGKLDIDDLWILVKTDVKFAIGSDAHVPEKVGTFEKAIERVMSVGITCDRIINCE